MQNSNFQTLHPEQGKKNRPVPVKEYNLFKKTILQVLKKEILTHKELEAKVESLLSKSFSGNVHWQVMVVKLDLEARKVIERSSSKPQRYRLSKPAA